MRSCSSSRAVSCPLTSSSCALSEPMASSMAILLVSPNNAINDATWMNLLETARSSFFTTYFSSIASPSSRMRPTSIVNLAAKSSTDSTSPILRPSNSERKD
uniref:Uncharacterized protein n=1 Tax=Triticum urartu TaxID=4572 RepID=A0A8R7VAV5_TRIUA